jgi:type IV pilus assembly protein PilA
MNSQFKLNLINHLANKKANKGFTLIELLVVVIIIGVLAAIALPNLLGQVGKARESEAKTTVGAVNRSQQSYYTEYSDFATSSSALEVPFGTPKYYTFSIPAAAVVLATNPVGSGPGKGNAKDGTRDYVGGVSYNENSRNFGTVVCRATNNPGFILTGAADLNDEGSLPATSAATLSVTCTGTTSTTK